MLGWPEILLILAIFLLIFGPEKLPKMARELGVALQEFRKASSSLAEAVESPERNRSPSGTSNRYRNQQIIDIAKKLNIKTDGKMTEQITKEILKKIEAQQKIEVKTLE